jgi:hypothetical protein
MDKKKRLWGFLFVGAVIVASLAALGIKDTRTQKPPLSPTAQQIAQNECASSALTDYVKAGLALSQQEGAALSALQPTIEITIARRRLQEQFCLRFAGCVFPDRTSQSLSLQYSLAFESCLKDEVQEQYNEK